MKHALAGVDRDLDMKLEVHVRLSGSGPNLKQIKILDRFLHRNKPVLSCTDDTFQI